MPLCEATANWSAAPGSAGGNPLFGAWGLSPPERIEADRRANEARGLSYAIDEMALAASRAGSRPNCRSFADSLVA
jgi:hypothetical protein